MWKHKLNNLDIDNKTASCSSCGHVSIRLMNKGKGRYVWMCYTSKIKGNILHRISDVNSDSRQGVCSVCGPIDVKLKTVRSGKSDWRCGNKQRKIQKKCRSSDKSKLYMEKYRKQWALINKDKVSRFNRRALLKAHGLTEEDYAKMVSVRASRCDLCQEVVEKLCVDHNHTTLKIRGLLCQGCNLALGHFKDRAEVASRVAAYLAR